MKLDLSQDRIKRQGLVWRCCRSSYVFYNKHYGWRPFDFH